MTREEAIQTVVALLPEASDDPFLGEPESWTRLYAERIVDALLPRDQRARASTPSK